jgi:hypothetical protein
MYSSTRDKSLKIREFAFRNKCARSLGPILLCKKSIQKPRYFLILGNSLPSIQYDLKELATLYPAHIALKGWGNAVHP